MSQTSRGSVGLKPDEKRALLERLLREKARRSTSFPLSFAQERLWFLNQLEPDSPFYNTPVAMRLTGRLSIPALERTLTKIVSRHEILRTSFPMVDGLPVQIISPAKQQRIPLADLSLLSEAERDLEARRLVGEESRHIFDLRQGSLLRVNLLRLGDEDHIVTLLMHHIISDGWSMGVLVREIAILYEAFLRDEPSPLPALSIQYADYAVWQRQWLQGDVLQEKLSYWKQQLGGAPPVLELPTDRPRPAVQSYRGASLSIELSEQISDDLRKISRQEGMTLFMTMLAAFKVLLYRVSGQQDILVGTAIAGRTRAELEVLIGFFVNTLVMRSKLEGRMSFKEVMRQEREVVVGGFGQQDVPFERVVEEVRPERSLSHSPLFQVMFALQNESREALQIADLKLEAVEIGLEIAKFDLSLSVVDSQDMAASIEYNTDLFDAATITRMLSHLHSLLVGICANPEQPISRLPLLTDAERRQLLDEWNDTKVEYPHGGCIHELFEGQAEQTPEAIAVVYKGEQLTYQELNKRANQLANLLISHGSGPEVLVGVCVERSLEMVVGLLGILKAGGAYVPLDPSYPGERLNFMLEDAGAPILLTQERFLDKLRGHGAGAVCLDKDWAYVAQHSGETPASGVNGDNLAYVIYTSGSTGTPKAAMNTHRGIRNRLLWMQDAYRLTAADCVMQKTPFSFDVSVWEFFWPLITGASLVMAKPEGHKDTAYLAQLIAEKQITTLHFVPFMLQVFLEEQRLERCASLRRVICSGEALPPSLRDRFFARLAPLGAELHNLYGPTEASVDVTSWRCEPGGDQQPVPIGRPIANTQIYILDSYLQPVPTGAPGQLYIGGVGLARGYLYRPDLTAERFIPDPFNSEPGARLYNTGDLARYLPGGNIEFLRRLDHQVKIRGFRIELGEVEAAIAQYPDVMEVVALAIDQRQSLLLEQREPDRKPDKAIDGKLLVAYIVPEQKSALEVSKLRGFLENRLPHYMVPSAFVVLNSLPLTPNGKVDRRALLASGISDPGREIAIPRDLLELQLAHIWEEITGVHPVGVRDNFFELGGHSLLAVRLMSRIRQSFGKELPLTTLFGGATVEHLACILRQQAEPTPWSPLVAIQPGGSNHPFFCVHPGGGNVLCYVELARHLGLDQPFYAFQSRGLDGNQPVCTRIEDMATLYIEAMRTVQPGGPYFLGGWSVGGVVAFEMARQLEAQGEQVALLALIDARAPGRQEDLIEEDDVAVMASFGQHLGLSLERINISLDHFLSLSLDERLAYVIEEAKNADLMPANITLAHARRLFEVFKANLTAMNNYSPGMARCRIALMKASERIADVPQELAMGWDELTENGMEVLEVPGNHFTMIREPYVRFMAERLKSCISEAMVSEQS